MKDKESRRIVPVSAITLAVLCLLFLFEALIIGGAIRLKSSTVARVAPWAYEPFLRLVGEHPDSYRERNQAVSDSDMEPQESLMDDASGFDAELFLVETNTVSTETNAVESPETDPGKPEEDPSREPPDEDVPVG